jgi:hypothetical protein
MPGKSSLISHFSSSIRQFKNEYRFSIFDVEGKKININ